MSVHRHTQNWTVPSRRQACSRQGCKTARAGRQIAAPWPAEPKEHQGRLHIGICLGSRAGSNDVQPAVMSASVTRAFWNPSAVRMWYVASSSEGLIVDTQVVSGGACQPGSAGMIPPVEHKDNYYRHNHAPTIIQA